MKQKIKKNILFILGTLLMVSLGSFKDPEIEMTYSLKVEVNELRNSKGTVQFALYNREDAFPDEHYKKYLIMLTGKIINGAAAVTFEDLPSGKYAVNVLHDEDNDGKIKKGVVLPKEGIGFSNYKSIGLFNKPTFSKASFDLLRDEEIMVTIIYM